MSDASPNPKKLRSGQRESLLREKDGRLSLVTTPRYTQIARPPRGKPQLAPPIPFLRHLPLRAESDCTGRSTPNRAKAESRHKAPFALSPRGVTDGTFDRTDCGSSPHRAISRPSRERLPIHSPSGRSPSKRPGPNSVSPNDEAQWTSHRGHCSTVPVTSRKKSRLEVTRSQ